MANKITTPSYLIKRLRESGFIVIRLFNKFAYTDSRKWTIMIDPAGASIMLTCYENYPQPGDISFEFNDGGSLWPKNFILKTRSVEVLTLQLLEKGISTYSKDNPFYKERIKEVNERG
jgi:hypothetical protein